MRGRSCLVGGLARSESPNKTHALVRGTGKGRRSGGPTEPLVTEGVQRVGGSHARGYRAKRLGVAARHQGAPPRPLRGGMGKSLLGSAGGWAGPRFYPLQSCYGISAGRGRTGGSGGIGRARGRGPALHHHAEGHGDAARSVISASLGPDTFSCLYSPDCVEGGFSELRLYGVLGSSRCSGD